MALSEDDKQAHLVEAMRFVTEDFHKKFQRRYSVAISTCGYHPEQVNNELRNMLTHVARAVTATTKTANAKEMSSAKGHLERAARDCLKLTNLHLLTELKADSFYIQLRDGTISTPLRRRLIKIEEDLAIARIIEVEGIEDDLLKRLEGINADLQELREDYSHILAAPGWQLSPFKRTGLTVQLWLERNLTGLIVGAVGALVGAYLWEDGHTVTERLIEFLQRLK